MPLRADTIHFAVTVLDQLRLALIDVDELRAALTQGEPEPVAHPPGCFRARPTLTVPRPMDPETAEMRQLEVYLRPLERGMEVFAVRGLGLDAVGE